MITLEVRLFATLKSKVGTDRVQITIEEPATLTTLIQAMSEAYPSAAQNLTASVAAINHDFAFADTPIKAGDEVALFPPVSGGSGHPTYFAITPDEPDLNEISRRLTRPDVGAIIFFHGSVRGETQRDGLPPETIHLEYEAYEGMAEAKMAQIAQEIWQKWPLVKGVALVQRIGQLSVGETTTLVACAAGHRDQGAFEAARYGIDRLKEIVPVWKKEVGQDQSVWVEGNYTPTPADVTST